MGDGSLIIDTSLDTSGIAAGSKEMMRAIKSFGNNVTKNIGNTAKKILGIFAGVGSAIAVLSKSISAYMSNHQQTAAQLQAVWGALGEVMGPIIERIVGLITTVVSYFINFLNLLGISGKNAKQAASDAQKASGSIQRSIMGFDELNKLSDGSGGGYQGSLSDEIPEWLSEISELLKNGMWEDAGKLIAEKLNDAIASVPWTEIGQKIGYYFNGALQTLYFTLKYFDTKALGQDIADLFNAAIKEIDTEYIGRLLVIAYTKILRFLYGFVTKTDWKMVTQKIADTFIGAMKEISEFFSETDWKEVAQNILTSIKNAWAGFFGEDENGSSKFKEIAESFATALGSALKAAIDFGGEIVETVWKKIKTAWDEYTLDEDGNFSLDKLKENIENSWKNIGAWIRLHIIEPFFKALGLQFDIKGKSSGLVSWVSELKTSISNKFDKLFPANDESDTSLGKKIITCIQNSLGDIDSFVTTNITTPLKDALSTGLSGITLPEGIENVITAFDSIDTSLGKLKKSLIGDTAWSETLGNILDIIFDCFEYTGTSLVPTVIEGIADGFTKFPDSLAGLSLNLKKIWNDFLKPALDWAGTSGVPAVMEAIASSLQIIDGLVGTVEPFLATLWNDFLQPLANVAFEGLNDVLGDLAYFLQLTSKLSNGEISFKDFIIGLSDIATGVNDAVRDIDKASDALTNYAETINQIEAAEKMYGKGGDYGWYENLITQAQAVTDAFVDMTLDEGQFVGITAENINAEKEQIGEFFNSMKEYRDVYVHDTETGMENLQVGVSKYVDSLVEMSGNTLTAQYRGQLLKESLIELTAQYYANAKNAETNTDKIDLWNQYQQQAAILTAEYNEVLGTQATIQEEMAGNVESLANSVENEGNSLANASQQTASAADSIDSMNKSTISANEAMANGGTAAEQYGTDVSAGTSIAETATEETEKSIKGTLENTETDFNEFGSELKEIVSDSSEVMSENFEQGITEMGAMAARETTDMNNVMRTNMGIIAQNAYVWGADIIILMNNGIVSAFNTYLMPTVAQVAQSIKDFLGFSEPKKGPLSDFHTYMPDMMKLMAEGIEDNEDIALNAVSDLANGISNEIQNGDYSLGKISSSGVEVEMESFSDKIVYGFESLLERLQAIADSVSFSMPQVAMGGVLPYSVASEFASIPQETTSLSDVLSVLEGLRTLLSSDSGENGTINVNLIVDGKVLADTVTKYQRQNSRASGR